MEKGAIGNIGVILNIFLFVFPKRASFKSKGWLLRLKDRTSIAHESPLNPKIIIAQILSILIQPKLQLPRIDRIIIKWLIVRKHRSKLFVHFRIQR